MKFEYIEDTVEILEKFLAKYGGKAISCTVEEVDQLESMLPDSYHLPAAYKEFLLYGGKAISKFYEEGSRFDYKIALNSAKDGLSIANKFMKVYEPNGEVLTDDTFILSTYMYSYFNFFKLTEGENPPVYAWSDEEELGIDAIKKKHNSFTDFIREEIRIRHLLLRPSVKREEISFGKFPRKNQFWIARPEEEIEGSNQEDIADYFGVNPLWKLEQIADACNITPIEYLEELSGWKAQKVGDEIRFFPL